MKISDITCWLIVLVTLLARKRFNPSQRSKIFFFFLWNYLLIYIRLILVANVSEQTMQSWLIECMDQGSGQNFFCSRACLIAAPTRWTCSTLVQCLAMNLNWWSEIRFLSSTVFMNRRMCSFSNNMDITRRSNIGLNELGSLGALIGS